MNAKERMMKVFDGKAFDRTPVAPHWWGLYKFQLAGIASGYAEEEKCWTMYGGGLAEVDALFYETFKPDWFHLGTGFDASLDKKYRQDKLSEISKHACRLESALVLDEYVSLKYRKADEIKKTTQYDHVKSLADKYGEEVFIALNEGNPICEILDPHGFIGFEEGLIALKEEPELMERLIFGEYEMMLEKVKVLKEYGCHGYIGSETYCTPDLIAPSTYRDLIFPAQQYFYKKVAEMGIVPIAYFLGDILPLMDSVNELGIKALLVEEPKKGYSLDEVEIRKRLDRNITLFGNLDSVYTLLYGSVEDVTRETVRQLETAKYGRFVMANGCPLAFDTPGENISAMVEAAAMHGKA